MKTINKLIELGLSKEMAVKVEDEIQIYKLFEIKMNQVTATKQEVIDSIVKAEPEFRQKDFVSQEDEFFFKIKKWPT